MEEKKFDINSIIGFVLIGGILLWMLYQNQPTEEELEAARIEAAKEEAEKATEDNTEQAISFDEAREEVVVSGNDSIAMANAQNKLGSFAYSASLPAAQGGTTVIENDVLRLTVSNKGGYITEALIKNETNYMGEPIYLIKDGNADLNLQFSSENRLLNSRDLFFEPELTQNGDNPVLSMKLKTGPDKFLEYRYELKPGEYMLDFNLRTQGLDGIVDTSRPINLD